MTGFPRPDYAALTRYDPQRSPVAIDLSDNTNLWGTPPAALEVVRSADRDALARYPTLYADALRDEVAQAFDLDPTCVTTGVGSDDVLDSAWRAAYRPGASVAFPAPTFSMIEPFCVMNGLRADPIPWHEAEDDPGRLLAGDPALVYVCRPNNPTGSLLPDSWLDELLDTRGADGPLVLVDEAYADFAGVSWLPRASRESNMLVARTFSKAYGLAGLRCGFAVGRPDVVLAVDKSRGPYKLASLAVRAAAAALRDEDGWVRNSIAEARASRDRFCSELEARGVPFLPSSANFVLLAAPDGDAGEAAVRLRAEGVGVRPFTDVPVLGEGIRVTVGPWALMQSFLEAFDRIRSEDEG
ncbi:MAG: histidinol-phosphate transaminase [Gemmatimonadota bacterium]